MKSSIHKDDLLKDGWVETPGDPTTFCEKKLPNRNPINSGEDSDIKLVLHPMYNSTTFAVALPNGALLNFVANTMDDLRAFENAITFYDPEF